MTREEVESLMPWPRPKSINDDVGANCNVTINGHRFRIRGTDDFGANSLRRRFSVECLTCNEVLHHGTTSATAQIHSHLMRGDE